MTSTVRRAGAFAIVGSLSLASPLLGWATAVPFAVIALLAIFVIRDGPLFELFARPGDREEGTLAGLAGFSLAVTALALLSTGPVFGFPIAVFAAVVCLLVYGNLVEELVRSRGRSELLIVTGFVSGAFVAGLLSQAIVVELASGELVSLPEATFLAASGALLAAMLRAVLYERDDPVVLLTVAVLLWLFADLGVAVSMTTVVVAIAITVVLGYLSFALGTASIPGMLTGILLGFLTIILGGYAWFAILICFFAIGGLATKYRYDEKASRGVAESNYGARGSANVLGNATVALFAVIGYAAAPDLLPLPTELFLFAFAGSLATALSDTLSSEIGSVFDNPRLITTMQIVEPGTDGAITWQGEVAGVVGALLIAVLSVVAFPAVGPTGAAIVAVAGIGGMTADSVLGATIEGDRVGNQGVNLLATLVGALLGSALAVLAGLAPLV